MSLDIIKDRIVKVAKKMRIFHIIHPHLTALMTLHVDHNLCHCHVCNLSSRHFLYGLDDPFQIVHPFDPSDLDLGVPHGEIPP